MNLLNSGSVFRKEKKNPHALLRLNFCRNLSVNSFAVVWWVTFETAATGEIMKSTSEQQLTGWKERSAAIWIYLTAMFLMKSLCKSAPGTCGRVWIHLHGKRPYQKRHVDLWRDTDMVQWPVQWDWTADKSWQDDHITSFQHLISLYLQRRVHALAHQLTRLGAQTHTTGSTITSPFILHLVTVWTLL